MASTEGQDGGISIGAAPDGAPLARAGSWRDAFLALGLLHGRDRGAQIELMRIVAQGRICERLIDNDATIALDRYFRRLRLYADAQAHIGELDAASAELLQSYTRGVNLARGRHFPWLYRALLGAPEPFVEADVLALINKFSNLECAITKARAELQPAAIDFKIDFVDVLISLGGFQGFAYPFAPDAASACP